MSFYSFYLCIIRRPPRAIRTATRFPYTTLVRSRQGDVRGGLEGGLVELPEWPRLCRRGADHHAERRGGEQAASDAVHGEVSLFRRLCIPSSLYERSLATRARSR